MMGHFAPAEVLRTCRPLLLAMEAVGWFHMAGKARAEFLKHHGGEKNEYRYEKWHDLETPPFPWDELLEWTKRVCGTGIPANAWPGSMKEFTEKHRDRNPGLLGLLQAAHGIVSGVEKNLPGSTSEYLNQTLLHMWLASPWGHPKRNLLADPSETLSLRGWSQLVAEIRRVLEEAKSLGTRNLPEEIFEWKRWREAAIGEGSFIRQAFLSTLAETRLPNNDVTLWDQSYVAAALFKSALAGVLLNSSYPWQKNQIKSQTRWRLLTVAIGTEHYEARSVKIGDWTGMQGVLQEFFRQAAELVEIDLAVGSLLYWDDTVAVFSFPGERYDETPPASWLNGWEQWLQEQVDKIAQSLALETPPVVRLSKPSRSLVPIVREQKEARSVVAIPVHRNWDIGQRAPSKSHGNVCPVCRVRLNEDPTRRTEPCRVCCDRRYHRRDDWLKGRLGYDTIWFEEVADRNGRLALLTFSLDVEPWLTGERVDSFRTQAISDWRRFNPSLPGNTANPIDPDQPFTSLVNYIHSILPNFNTNDPVMTSLQDGYCHESSWQSFFQKIVEDRAQEDLSWNALDDDQRAAWLAHQLFVKLPSPGRVHRFWREAEEFFGDLFRKFRQIASRSDNRWRVRRFLLIPEDASGWRDLTLYDGRWRGVQLSLVYVQSLGGFVTASNLSRLLGSAEPAGAFRGETIPLEEEDRFGYRRDMQVRDVWELDVSCSHLSIYAPVIPLSLSPLRFRVLVPLEVASECVDLAVRWWKERFARVWDRLPLRVGVIGFPRLLPYQAVVEAVRNVEGILDCDSETWWIDKVEECAGVVTLHLRQGEREMFRNLPVVLPDGRFDVFYPYVEVEDRALRASLDFRHPADGRIFRHVSKLCPGDTIQLVPAGVLTLFMDTTAARFAVPEKPRLLDEWEAMRAVWEHLRRVAPSQTALQDLYTDIQRMERDWRGPDGEPMASEDLRRETYRALLAHHLEAQEASLEYLTQAAMRDWLTWAIEWHLFTLKESL